MLATRIVVPISVLTLGSAAAAAGVLHANAAETAACSVTYTVRSQWNSGFTGFGRLDTTAYSVKVG